MPCNLGILSQNRSIDLFLFTTQSFKLALILLGLVLNILQATLPRSLQGHTTMFAFLGVIAILVLQPGGMIVSIRKLRRKRDQAAALSEGAPS